MFTHILFFTLLFLIFLFSEYPRPSCLAHVTWQLNGHTIEALFLFFWPRCMACGILVPWPGMESNPWPLQWKHGVLTTGLPRKSLKALIKQSFLLVPIYFPNKQKEISHLPGKDHFDYFTERNSLLFYWQAVDYNSLFMNKSIPNFSHIKVTSQEKTNQNYLNLFLRHYQC